MPKTVLETSSAPAALGPYSVAVGSNNLVFLSGQVPIDPGTGERAPDDIDAQTRRVLDTIGMLLGDLGLDFADVVKTTVFMTDIADYPRVNDIYAAYFDEDPPARSAVQVAALPGGFKIEIEVIAASQ